MVCAIYTDACNPRGYQEGDIGGALTVIDHSTHLRTMVGMVRNPRGCPSIMPDYPEVYTKVFNFVDWINQTIADNWNVL